MRATTGVALAAMLLAGCAGGGSSSVPARPAQTAKQLPVAISITIPPLTSGTSSTKRHPAYVSTATRSAIVDVTPAGGPTTRTVIACLNSHCSGSVPATIGADTFAIALNDRADGTGNTLAAGQTIATVAEGKANSVSVTFNGVIASLQVAFDHSSPPVNTPATIAVLVTAYDAAGRAIIGPGTYDSPIALSDADASGATTLSAKTIAAPGDPPPTVAYNGAWIGGESASAIITASVPANADVKSATAQIVPMPQVVEFTIPTTNAAPMDLTTGPDGALWFPEDGAHKIGRMTTAGAFTEFPIPGQYSAPVAIASGGDGNLYVADIYSFNETFDQVTTGGAFTRHSIASQSFTQRSLYSMVWGPDNNLWATDYSGNLIARFTTTGVETDFPVPIPNAGVRAITLGSDGALWFTESNIGAVGRITTAGTVTEYPIFLPGGQHGGESVGMTTGPDGALWYTDNYNNAIGRMTTAGAGAEFASSNVAQASGAAIIAGPDGAIYFSNGFSTLGRISAKGTLQGFTIPNLQQRGSSFTKFAIGSDGNIWYADQLGNVIGKLVF